MKNIACTVVGDAMIDITMPLSGIEDIYYLSQGGALNTEMRLSPGGAANVAFYITKLGGRSAFIGCVGDDYFGRIFRKDLKQNNIVASVSVSKTESTGLACVLVFPHGERFFVVSRGANASLRYEDINTDLILSSRYLFLTGFSFQDEITSGSIERLLEEEEVSNSVVVFNPGAPNLARYFEKQFINFIHKYADILILNKAEAEYLTRKSSEKEMLDYLTSLADTVVITGGDSGSIVAGHGEIHSIATDPLPALDTTGAGDAYAAGFIYGLSRQMGLREAGELATRVAARVVTRIGARVDLSDLTLQ